MKKVHRNSRITTYADSGRISLRSITDTIKYHIEHNDHYYAQKAMDEYRSAIKKIFDEGTIKATQFQQQIDKIKGSING